MLPVDRPVTDPPQDGDRPAHPGPDQRRLAQALEALSAVQLQLDDERLRRQAVEDLFEEMLASMPDAVLLLDRRALVARANRAAELLFARDTAELIGLEVADLFDRTIPASPWELLEAASGGQTTTEARALRPDRAVVPVSLSAALLRDHFGKVDGAVYVARDLSGTHRLLHEVEAARARWRLLVEVGDNLHRDLDPVESLPDVVDAVARTTGWGVAVLLTEGTRVTRALAAPADGPARGATLMEGEGVPPGTALDLALRTRQVVRDKDVEAHTRVLHAREPPIGSFVLAPLVARGAALGALLIASDQPLEGAAVEVAGELAARLGLTLANACLRVAVTRYEAVQEANRLREHVVSGLSHDVRTPLAVLLASVESLRDHPSLPPEQRQDLLGGMERQTRQLQRLVRQFLDYTRLEAGHPLELAVRPSALGELLARAVDGFRGKARIHLEVPVDLPSAAVDPARFEQAVSNAISSAVQLSGLEATVTVTARAAPGALEITIANHGPGIPPADLPHLFERFRSSEDAARGGVGLFLTKRLVEAMGGTITAMSGIGEGTRLTLRVPVAERARPAS